MAAEGGGGRRLRVRFAAALVVGAAGACGWDRGEESSRRDPPRGSVAGHPRSWRGVSVALTGRAIRIDTDSVPRGYVSFSVVNAARRPFALVVSGPEVELRTRPIPPGGRETIGARLDPGCYRVRTSPRQDGPAGGPGERVLIVNPAR